MSELNVELRPSWKNYWFGIFISIVTLPLFGLGLLIFAIVAYSRFSKKYIIKQTKVAESEGLLTSNEQSIRLDEVKSVEINQGLGQKMFGVGDLLFYSAGSDKAEVKFLGTNTPSDWKDKIENRIDEVRGTNN